MSTSSTSATAPTPNCPPPQGRHVHGQYHRARVSILILAPTAYIPVASLRRGEPSCSAQNTKTRSSRPPGLAQLPDLVGRFHDSGVDASLTIEPGLRLPRDLALI
jgi:hypothetical protein